MDIFDPKEPWHPLPDNTEMKCNKGLTGWVSDGGCGKMAAYELIVARPGWFAMRSCIEHHREHLRDQEKIGKVEWIEKPLPGGGIQLIRHDPYADHGSGER